ncbi:inner membrane protein YhaH [Demequina sediminis]|uniref:Inner membrane protein YhaH n=1 Tax=Demequina sediminis TaxID=1930058 RepID=A0ABP9WHN9_9MICO
MTFGEAVSTCLRAYAGIRGRARRSEFWWFQLFAAVLWLPTVATFSLLWGAAFEGSLAPAEDPAINPDAVGWGALTGAFGVVVVYLVVVVIPSLSVWARRLHDTGMSSAWILLSVVGLGIIPLIMAIPQGQPGANKYGPDPRVHSRVAAGR